MTVQQVMGFGLALSLAAFAGACSDNEGGTAGSGGDAGAGGASGSSGAGGSAGMGGSAGGTGGTGGAGGAGGTSTERADLVIRSIGTPGVACPGGGGTCVTTVEIGIENIGAGDAPAFNFEVTFDPDQSVAVGQSVPGGLGAGLTQFFTITTPEGDNCFDPDCTVSVLVDDMNDVVESDETNNTDSTTVLG
jgi:hypothetical protein